MKNLLKEVMTMENFQNLSIPRLAEYNKQKIQKHFKEAVLI